MLPTPGVVLPHLRCGQGCRDPRLKPGPWVATLSCALTLHSEAPSTPSSHRPLPPRHQEGSSCLEDWPGCAAGLRPILLATQVLWEPWHACRQQGPARGSCRERVSACICICVWGDRGGDEHRRVPSSCSGAKGRREMHAYSCCFEAPGPVKPLSWMPGKHGQDGGTKLKPGPSESVPFSVRAVSRGSCVPCPGVQGPIHASGLTAFRNSPSCHPGGHSPRAHVSCTGRALQDGDQGQVRPLPSCPFPQGSLDSGLSQPRGQRLTGAGYSIEDTKLRGGPVPSGASCSPILSLDVPIKMESDSGSEDAANGYSMSPGQVWLRASGLAKGQMVTFPTRMHLKTELEARPHLYAPHLGRSLLEAPLSGRGPLRAGRELVPSCPAHCACLGRAHGLLEPDPPPNFCAQGHQPPALGSDCRAPGTVPIVKREPLDSPPWASQSQGGVPGMFPKSAVATLMPPKAPEGAFLP